MTALVLMIPLALTSTNGMINARRSQMETPPQTRLHRRDRGRHPFLDAAKVVA